MIAQRIPSTHLQSFRNGSDVALPLGELFCGPGGIGRGSSWVRLTRGGTHFRFTHAWANDYHAATCETYRHNIAIEPEMVFCEDVRKFIERFPELPSVAGLTFGFPCNDFSAVGERRGLNGHFGGLYSYCVQAVRFFQPLFFVAENVSGLLSSNEGDTFQLILRELAAEGYELTPNLYKFENYGVPQCRRRIIVVGFRKDLGIRYKVPAPTQRIPITAGEALCNIPVDAKNHEQTRQSHRVVERLSHIKPGENAWTAKLPVHLQIKTKAKLSTIYKKLDPNLPAYTVTGSGGGGTHIYHWSENRALTNRERARLQSFDDDFVFMGSKEEVRRQIGMAVPPKGAKTIMLSVLRSLLGEEYECVDPNLFYNGTTD